MANIKKYDWPGVEYASPEYYRLWRLANNDKSREYHRAYDRAMYKKYPEREKARRQRYAAKYPYKIKAHEKLNRAVAKGIVIRQACRDCSSPKTVGHHYDYDKPLDVIWLCELHHKAEHAK